MSPDTQSAKFSAFDASGTVVASAYAACTATCASQLAVYPGTYTFRIDLFDGPNGTGNVLSTGTTTSTIGTSATSVSVPLGGGTVAYVDLTLEPATVSSGAPKTLALYVDAEDADGNFIVGSDPYTTPIQLTSTDPTNLTLSSTTVTSPGSTVTVTYSGVASASLSLAATVSSGSGDSTFLSVDGATPPPQIVGLGNDPVQRYHAPGAPTTGGTAPAPEPPAVVPTAAPQPAAIAQAAPVSVFGSGAGFSSYAAINPTSKRAIVGLASLNNVEGIATVPLSNFQISVSQSGLSTFSLRPHVIDLAALRRPQRNLPPDVHPRSPLEQLHPIGPGRATAAVRHRLDLPTVGATQAFFVGSTQQTFTARAITAGNRAVIWTANTLPPDATSAGQVAQYVTMTQNAQAAIDVLIGVNAWPANAPGIRTYGTCNPDGTRDGGSGNGYIADPGYVNAVVYDRAAVAASDPLVANSGGFFAPGDLTPVATTNCIPPAKTNQTEIIYIKWTSTSAGNQAYMRSTFTHEYGHLASFVQKAILQPGQGEFPWVLEGLGFLTQDYTAPLALQQGNPGNPSQPTYDVDSSMPFLANFLAAPQNFSLTGFAGIQNGAYAPYSGTNYGLSYLFLKYLTDRYGNAFVTELHTTTDRGSANIANAATRRCTALNVQPCPVSFNQLFSDFVTMLAVSNTGITADPRYNMQSFSLRGTYTSAVTGASITLNGPATVGTLTPGQTATVQSMFRGGFAFFNFDNFNPNGSTIRLDDLTGGALQLYGTIGQQ
ncbi:MAG: hypothetical protein JOZ24_00225 [Candidatus Eremiobacteraeota bacterium]|nr:hypothetical protein [Candidatus Eremiobacteraeota bacterium]